jgi:hypothetical protein
LLSPGDARHGCAYGKNGVLPLAATRSIDAQPYPLRALGLWQIGADQSVAT